MLIWIDKNAPAGAVEKLGALGEVVLFDSCGGAYRPLDCHPDIFLCQAGPKWVAAPNLPEHYFEKIAASGADWVKGKNPVGSQYPHTAGYNAVAAGGFFIHNTACTDPAVLDAAKGMKRIEVSQGYCRCGLIALGAGGFITSDEGICRALLREGLNVLRIGPGGILLPGFSHGFIGGACGFYQGRLYIMGSLNRLKDGVKIRKFTEGLGYSVVELYDGPVYDGGGILFVSQDGDIPRRA